MEIEARIRRWGNSYGVRIPKDTLEEARLREDDMIILSVRGKRDMSGLFGLYRFKRPTSRIMQEIREGYDD